MKKIILLLLLVFVVSGCAELQEKIPKSLPGLGPSEEGPKLLGAGGKIDMVIQYPQEKDQVFKDIDFAPRITVANTGSADATGQVCISGLDSDVFAGASGCECLTYTFVKLPEEKFEPETLSFGPYQVATSQQITTDFTITAVNRYAYKSQAIFKPIISKDLTASDVSVQETANGPISIKSIKQEIVPTQGDSVVLGFKIELEKASKGSLISESQITEECTVSSMTTLERMKAQPKIQGGIESFPTIGDIPCKEVTLNKEGKGTMECIVGQVNLYDSSGNYIFNDEIQTPSKLIISYGFEERDSNSFSIGSTMYA